MSPRAVRILFLSLLISPVASRGWGREVTKVAKYAKVYKGDEGIKVVVVPFDPPTRKLAFIKVTGINHEWDGVIFVHEIRGEGARLDYVKKVDNHDYVTLIARPGWDDKPKYTLFTKGVADDVPLTYSEELSEKTKAEDILAEYLKQK